MSFSLKFTGDGMPRFQKAVESLGSETKARTAYRMALNDSNKQMFTQVKRAVAKQMGASQARVVKYGHMRKVNASNGKLMASVESAGGYLPLNDFKARTTQKGVSAAPWGQRRIFGGTFIVGKIGGNVFRNTKGWSEKSGRFNAIEKLWGPAVPNEMVKDESEAAYERVARVVLPREVARQIKRLSGGAVT